MIWAVTICFDMLPLSHMFVRGCERVKVRHKYVGVMPYLIWDVYLSPNALISSLVGNRIHIFDEKKW